MLLAGLLCAVALGTQPRESDLAAAVKLWQDMKMPVLSPNSRPVIVPLGYWESGATSESVGVGFSNPVGGGPASFLLGARIFSGTPGTTWFGLPDALTSALARGKPADWSVAAIAQVVNDSFTAGRDFGDDTTLCGAIVSQIAGHDEFAEALLRKVKRKDSEWSVGEAYLGLPKDRSILASTAFQVETRLANDLLEPNSDRRAVLGQLRQLASADLIVAQRNSEGIQELIQNLSATVAMAPGSPNSPEAAVRDLTNATGIEIRGSSHDIDPRVDKVSKMGLAAAPSLINHLNDKRLTRSISLGMNMAGPAIIPLGWVADSLLEQLSGGDIVGSTEQMTEEQASAWYRAKVSDKVDDYLLARLIDTWGANGQYRAACARTFKAIVARHQGLLEKAYRRVLKVDIRIDWADGIIEESSLSRAQKTKLFELGAQSSFIQQRDDARRYLSKSAG